MCVKIIRSKEEVEFDPFEPLEYQVRGAKQVVVDYNPNDTRLQSFMDQVERIIRSGISCQMNIKVNPNNYLNGIKMKKNLEQLELKLDVNEVIKGLSKIHSETDQKLCELSRMCEKPNET